MTSTRPHAGEALVPPHVEPTTIPELDVAAPEIDPGRAGSLGSGIPTRDLLAEIASREPAAPRPARLERAEHGFVRWTLATAVVLLALLLAITWWLDPTGVTSRQTRFAVVENAGVRQAKLDLMERLEQPPGVLVLGSSRSMKVDPADIEELAGVTAFNGAVSGGTAKDTYLYAAYAEQRWGGEGGTFPHLVIGVVNDSFRDSSTARFDPRLAPFLATREREQGPLSTASALLQMKTVEAAVRSVRRVVPREGAASLLEPEEGVGRLEAIDFADEGAIKANQGENIDERGMQLFDPVNDMDRPLADRVERQMADYVRRSYEGDPDWTGMDDRGLSFLRRTIEIANRNGDVPTLWVTPFQPSAVELLPPAYEARHQRFLEAIEQLEADPALRFRFVPETDDIATWGGDPDQFYDGIHPTPENTSRLLAWMHEQGLLERAATRTSAS